MHKLKHRPPSGRREETSFRNKSFRLAKNISKRVLRKFADPIVLKKKAKAHWQKIRLNLPTIIRLGQLHRVHDQEVLGCMVKL